MAERSTKDYFKNKKRYQESGLLGKGGMAVVFESKDEYFQRHIAYKKLKAGPSLARRTEEFVREALIMGQLEHPGILPVHELIRSDGEMPAITMDKVSGQSLAEKIEASRNAPREWPLRERFRIFHQLVEIVAYSQSRGILHRDIKPANVMLGENGEVILLDWGLAKVMQSKEKRRLVGAQATESLSSSESVSGSIKGTPYYMSPESAMGQVDKVRETSDVFSLGALFYEMLTLKRMIVGVKATEVLKNAAESRYEDLSKQGLQKAFRETPGAKLPGELVFLLSKMVAREPKDRYRDAEELGGDVNQYMTGQPIQGYSQPFEMGRAIKWMKAMAPEVLMVLIPIVVTVTWLMLIFHETELMKGEVGTLEESLSKLERGGEHQKEEMAHQEGWEERTLQKIRSLGQRAIAIEERLLLRRDQVAKNQVKAEQLTREHRELKHQNQMNQLELEQLEKELKSWRDKYQVVKKIQRENRRDEKFEQFKAAAGHHAENLREIVRGIGDGEILTSLKRLENSPSRRVDPLATPWLYQRLSDAVRLESDSGVAGASPPLLTENEKLIVMTNLMNHFPELHVSEVIPLADGHLIFSDEGQTFHLVGRGMKPWPTHPAIPTDWRLSEDRLYGLYDERRLFALNEEGEPFVVIHPEAIQSYGLSEGRLAVTSDTGRWSYGLEPMTKWSWWTPSKKPLKSEPREIWLETSEEPAPARELLPAGYRPLQFSKEDQSWLIAFVTYQKQNTDA